MKHPASFWLYILYRLGPIALVLLTPLFVKGEYYLGLGQTILYYAIAIIGLNILIGNTGQISLGHSGFMAVGAYTSALLATNLNWPLWITFPLAAFMSGVVGFIVALPAIRTRGLYLAMITVAFGFVAEILSQRWVELTGGTMGIYGVPQPALFGKEFGVLGYFYLIAVTWAVLQWMADNLVESRWGRVLLALKNSEEAAENVGINVNRQKVIAFVISAAYTGIAGFFLAHQTGYLNSDNFSINISIFFLVALVIGGTGSRWGPLAGAILLTVISQVLASLYEYRFFLYGGILLATLVLLPEGILGGIEGRLRHLLLRLEEEAREKEELDQADINKILAVQNWKESSNEILRITKLTRRFGGLIAINEVDLTIRRGLIHAIIGPNGAGKTTLINLVTGNLKSDEGSIRFRDLQVDSLSTHGRASLGIARTFQNPQLFNELSVLENVILGFYRHFKTGPVAYSLSLPSANREETKYKEYAINLLRFLGIEHLAYKNVNDLPYGYQKLVEIARALSVKPDLILLDEAVAGLNPSETEEIFKVLEKLRHRGLTILLVEHNMDFIMRISDMVSVINFGKKIAEGSPEEIQKNPRVIEAYLGRGDIVQNLEGIRQKERLEFQQRQRGDKADRDRKAILPEADQAMLRVQGLSVHYGKVEVLKEIDLEVRHNEVVCLIGANGAGKTTLIRAVSGLAPIIKGEILFENNNLKRFSPHKIAKLGIAHVPQGRQIIPDLSVEGNLDLGAYRFTRADRQKVLRLKEQEFERFPILGERRNQVAASLSGGEQQMLAISRALMLGPRFIMMDEPSLGLAPLVVEEIVKAIWHLHEFGITILLIEQAATLALAMAHRGYVLQNGKVFIEGTGQELLENPDVIKGYLGG